jgi:hypothetical protein
MLRATATNFLLAAPNLITTIEVVATFSIFLSRLNFKFKSTKASCLEALELTFGPSYDCGPPILDGPMIFDQALKTHSKGRPPANTASFLSSTIHLPCFPLPSPSTRVFTRIKLPSSQKLPGILHPSNRLKAAVPALIVWAPPFRSLPLNPHRYQDQASRSRQQRP